MYHILHNSIPYLYCITADIVHIVHQTVVYCTIACTLLRHVYILCYAKPYTNRIL